MSAPRPGLVPIDRLVTGLTDRLEGLCAELFPEGKRDGPELVGWQGRTLKVHLDGTKRGVWCHFSAQVGGDPLDLVAYVQCGGNKVEAIKWAKSWLGLDGETVPAWRPPPPEEDEARRRDAAEDEAKRRAAAVQIWLSAAAELRGTPVEDYLAGRGIGLRALPFAPGAVRFHPGLWNAESQRKLPAMVAAIVGPHGKQVAVHRTWLAPDGRGGWGKAALRSPKATLGTLKGGFVSLWKGVSVDPETGEVRKAPPLSQAKGPVAVDMTEGIEDGLTVALACPERRVMAGISVGNWASIRLPEAVAEVWLWRQNDPVGSPAEKAFAKVVASFQGQGRRVFVVAPPQAFKDVNDMVKPESAPPAIAAAAAQGIGA